MVEIEVGEELESFSRVGEKTGNARDSWEKGRLYFRDMKQVYWPVRKKLKAQDLPVKAKFFLLYYNTGYSSKLSEKNCLKKGTPMAHLNKLQPS